VAGPYREFGPVFVLAHASDEAVDLGRLPVTAVATQPAGEPYLRQQFVLRAYSSDERILDAVMSSPGDAEERLERLFADPEVAFVHARFPLYGCFACRIERR
jgi:hypothetical protein